MLEALIQGFSYILHPETLWIVVLAALAALAIGIVPVIGGIQLMALMVVLILFLPPEIGLLLLVAFAGVAETGGSMTSILLNIPGTGLNAATLIDGFPMTQKGEASRAIGAALTSSVLGGMAAVILAIAMIPVIIPLVLAMRVGDVAILVLLGLTFLATMTSKSVIKGLIAGLLGMFSSFIGYYHPASTARFMFNSVYLSEGLGIAPVVMGLFGVSTMLDVLIKGQTTLARGTAKTKFSDLFAGVKDVLHHWWLWLRCTVIGYVVGVIPGIGGSVATFGAYGYAKQVSKNTDQFGSGCVEGVIAPESANNASAAGALLTTLAFGIPGSASMVILLAALFAINIIPGPALITGRLPLLFTLLAGLMVCNLIAGLTAFIGARWLIKIAYTPIVFIFPVIIVLVFVGAYAERITMVGVLVMLVFSVLGLIMTRLDYSKPSFVLGFVLAGLFEENLFLAIKTAGPFFFTTKISIIVIILIITMFSLPAIKKMFAQRRHRRLTPQ